MNGTGLKIAARSGATRLVDLRDNPTAVERRHVARGLTHRDGDRIRQRRDRNAV